MHRLLVPGRFVPANLASGQGLDMIEVDRKRVGRESISLGFIKVTNFT